MTLGNTLSDTPNTSLFATRATGEELMDQPETPRAEFREALDDIRWVNRTLNGTRSLLAAVKEKLTGVPLSRPLSILDLGTGSADIPMALVDWARSVGRDLRVVALDLHPEAVSEAFKAAAEYPEITVTEGNALYCPEPDGAYDLVISSMFLHHLDPAEGVRLLSEMARMGRLGFIVNDLERHPVAYHAIRLLGLLTGKGRIFMHDAPLSVLRGFTLPELEAMLLAAGVPDATIHRRFPYRWILSGPGRA